jgi:hypothetical protein
MRSPWKLVTGTGRFSPLVNDVGDHPSRAKGAEEGDTAPKRG